ncbi:RNA-guided endonuclease InsQ/TnpB family protein [Azohydromonas australica]|uniref:RNA-guided endonuclease InsQ/TnpB family protein n=1 Tax=Azohydromonas australica TaxID=364039 RepID=UPI00040A915A|nr:transposase [Azohydromonas australica]
MNTLWNYCNELSRKVWERARRFLSGFDFWPFLKGMTKEGLGLTVQTVQEVAEQYAVKRRAARKTRLAWRKSGGARRSLGWLPFKVRTIRYAHGQVCYAGQWLSLWDSYGLGSFELRAGSISEDARGRWYLNVTVNEPDFAGPLPMPSVGDCLGIDLGLKELAALSSGEKVAAQRFYRDLEPALATVQRAGKKERAKAVHAKIAHRRRDHLQKLSTTLVRQHRGIFVGNVNAQALARTHLAKSVLDAGWSALRIMLQTKCERAGVWFREVDEAFPTQTCSSCGSLPPGRPKGIAGLGIRAWTCSACGAVHDRDVNAARNILAVGHGRLAGGITVFLGV